jgi:hypothetical protein
MTPAHDPIVAAARRTLAEPGARFENASWSEPGGGPLSTETGVTAFGQRRTVTQGREWAPGFEELMSRVSARWPWLEDDREEEGESYTLFAGTWCGFRLPTGSWTVIADGDPAAERRGSSDPTWILEVLATGAVLSRPRDAGLRSGSSSSGWAGSWSCRPPHGGTGIPASTAAPASTRPGAWSSSPGRPP